MEERRKRVKGRVVLMKKGVLDFHDIKANVVDRVHELLGKGVSIQLISATSPDPGYLCNSTVLTQCLHTKKFNFWITRSRRVHTRQRF